jgi:hypothetical protein
VSVPVVWRVEALAAPVWARACIRCGVSSARFVASERFRVNAHQGRLDVWLLHHCAACGDTAKRRLHHRVPVASVDASRLDGYHRNDAALARAHAFELPAHEPLPHRIVRPPLPHAGALEARIEQPFACGLRWDRLLAAELSWSRARVAKAWADGVVAVGSARSPRDRVADGQLLRVEFG